MTIYRAQSKTSTDSLGVFAALTWLVAAVQLVAQNAGAFGVEGWAWFQAGAWFPFFISRAKKSSALDSISLQDWLAAPQPGAACAQ